MHRGSIPGGIAGRLLVIVAAAACLRGADAREGTKARVKERATAVYPYDLALRGVEGTADLQFNVDPEGQAQDVIVAQATDPAFGFAAKAMLEAWRFEPVTERGDAVWVRNQSLRVTFESASADVALDASARQLLAELKKDKPAIASAAALDGVPWATKTEPPVYPRDLMKGRDIAGKATIDFLVDETGRAQLPRIVSSSQWEFGWAAATAILRFKFTPPTKGGVPAATRLRLPVVFSAPPPPKAGGAP